MIKNQNNIRNERRRARSVMQGLETYCGDVAESPVLLKTKPKAAPARIITLDGIMHNGNDSRNVTQARSQVVYGQAKRTYND